MNEKSKSIKDYDIEKFEDHDDYDEDHDEYLDRFALTEKEYFENMDNPIFWNEFNREYKK